MLGWGEVRSVGRDGGVGRCWDRGLGSVKKCGER